MKKELATATKYTYKYVEGRYVEGKYVKGKDVLLNKSKVYLVIIDEKQIIDEDGDRYYSGRKIGKSAPSNWCSKDYNGYYNSYKNIVRESEC